MTPGSEDVFDCQRCGHCCQGSGGIVLTAKDLRRLAAHLGLTPTATLEAHAERVSGRDRLRVGTDAYCVFYNHDIKGCGIHPARPDVCRAWPFFAGRLQRHPRRPRPRGLPRSRTGLRVRARPRPHP